MLQKDNIKVINDTIIAYYVDRFVFPEPLYYRVTADTDGQLIASCKRFDSHVDAYSLDSLVEEIEADLRETIIQYGTKREPSDYQRSWLENLFGGEEGVQELCYPVFGAKYHSDSDD